MKRSLSFSRLVGLSLLRDPLSYIFCVGTPTGLMLLFYIIYVSMSPEARENVVTFRPDVLTPGIAFFGFAFVMLFGTLVVSRDRTTAFLDRLQATPLRTVDFLVGYTLPLFVLGIMQCILTICFGAVLGATVDAPLAFGGCVLTVLALLPALLFFIGLGITFGSLLSATAAPGATSVLITLSGMMGGIWMPLETAPKLEKLFSCFPFLHMVRLSQDAMSLTWDATWVHLLVTFVYTLVGVVLPLWLFPRALKRGK